jgi:dihydroorotate dehydrogenase subfamily 1
LEKIVPNLTTIYVGLKLRAPIIAGSAGITETVERMKKAEDNGVGAVVMTSLFEDEISQISPTPRFKLIDYGKEAKGNRSKSGFSLYSYEQGSEWGLERYAEEVYRAKKELDIPIIASINCISEKGWISYAKRLEKAGADALEINLSCPHGSIIFRGKEVEKSILDTVRLVRENVSLPIIAKISSQLTSPVQIIKEIESIGANGITIFNRLTGVDIDIEEERPIMHQGYAGYGGPWAIHQSLRWISEILPQLRIDISGSGGVSRSEDIIKYLLAGATTVQTVTAIFLNGYGIIEEFVQGLKEYMNRKGYEKIEDFRGKICSRIKGTYQIKRDHYLKAEINDKLISPCQAACPAGIDIQGYVALISQGRFQEAFSLIREKVPFPLVLSRVCPAPCELECIRGRIDAPVAINALKRFVADWQMEKEGRSKSSNPEPDVEYLNKKIPLNISPPGTKTSQSKVAIIGAGPAGLTCAHDLAKMGHKVTIFESLPVAGGMLSAGIPQYRLPKEIVQEEIKQIQNLGIEIKLNTTIGRDLTLDELKGLGCKAIFIAIGAHKDKKLDIPGENLRGVIPGSSFLKSLNLGKEIKVGKRVAVIGGGNTAVDAARCNIRLGAKEVYLIYRRTKEEIPAIFDEIEQAEEEGVKKLYLTAPVKIVGKNGRVSQLKCIPLVLGSTDTSGRRKPSRIPASCFSLEVDTVIVAIGQTPELSFLEQDSSLRVNRSKTLAIDSDTYATSAEGIFAAGDVVSGPATVIEVIAGAKKAAISIDRYLNDRLLRRNQNEEDVVISPEKVLREKGFVEPKERKISSFISLEMRRSTFEEVEKALTEEEAIEEAERCLACGCGLGCGVCEKVCIYSAIEKISGRYRVNNEKCDGCGLCVEVCPKENMRMVEP